MLQNLFSPDGAYARAMNWFWNILVLSVLYVLCCLPVFTIGAASTAAYYAASKVIRHKTGKIHTEFFASFRRNFRQSVPLTVLMLLVQWILAAECFYFYSDSNVPLSVLVLFAVLFCAACAQGCYLWACLSRFDRGIFAFCRMSLALTFRHILSTVLLLLLLFGCVIGIYFQPWGILIFPGLALVLSTYPMERILLKYSPRVSENDPEAQKWYYQ